MRGLPRRLNSVTRVEAYHNTDAPDAAIGAVLSHVQEGKERLMHSILEQEAAEGREKLLN